jgi:hypothetical protein
MFEEFDMKWSDSVGVSGYERCPNRTAAVGKADIGRHGDAHWWSAAGDHVPGRCKCGAQFVAAESPISFRLVSMETSEDKNQ